MVYIDQINFDYKDKEKERLALLETLIEHTEGLLDKQPEEIGLITMAGFLMLSMLALRAE